MIVNLVEKIKDASDDEKLNVVSDDIVSDILKGTLNLVDVVTNLGQYLTNEDVSKREHGVNVLTTVLSKLPKDFLSQDELQPITLFYCDRLKDHFSITPVAIRGIHNLVQMKNLPPDGPFKLLTAFFRDIRCQSENPRTRRVIYAIFATLLSTRLKDLQAMGPDFIYGFISAVDGECDPTSLDLLFKIMPQIFKEFTLGHLTEEMFEILACYFPVDFQSEGKDGTGITRENLVQGLENCLSSVPAFAEFSLPLIIEKLDTNLKKAKYDSLHLLVRSASTYGAKSFEQHPDLWPAIRKEIMSGSDEEIKTIAMTAVTEITRVLSEDEALLKTFVDRVFDDVKWNLCDENRSGYLPAEKLIESMGKASPAALRLVLKVIIPLCLGQYSSKTSEADKIILIETLNNFMALASNRGFKISDVAELAWTDLPSLYLTELSSLAGESELKAKVIDGLVIQRLSLTANHRKQVYNLICDEVDRGNTSTKTSCHSALSALAQLHPDEVLEIIHERLNITGDHGITVSSDKLEALTAMASVSTVGMKILPMFLQVVVSGTLDSVLPALNCLENLLNAPTMDFNVSQYLYNNCDAIAQLLNGHFTRGSDSEQLSCLVSKVLRQIIRQLSKEEQRNIVEKHLCVLKCDIEKNILVLEGLLTSLMPVNITSSVADLLDGFVDVALHSCGSNARLSACRVIAVVFNKMNDDTTMEKYLNNTRERVMAVLENKCEKLDVGKAAVVLHTWITKAIIIMGSKKTKEFMNSQVVMLKNEIIGEFAGEQFKIFVHEEKILLNDNYCTIKLFYKQRILQQLLEYNSMFKSDFRINYLIAFINFVAGLPLELLNIQLTKLVPLLIECLSLDNSQSLTNTLKILKTLLDKKHEIFIAQMQYFMIRCLDLSRFPDMSVRMGALDCLMSYCSYPVVSIKPYRENVLEKLAEALDDRKRLVRQVAVAARTRWFLVGAPGGPE